MTQEAIIKIIEKTNAADAVMQVHFKQRTVLNCVFVKRSDYEEMKAKNFWRIVQDCNVNDYKQSKNISLTRLFNGVSISKIKLLK